MNESAALPELFTADVTSDQVLTHLRELRIRSHAISIRMSTREHPAAFEGQGDSLETALRAKQLIRAVIRFQGEHGEIVDSILRTPAGHRIVRMLSRG